MLNQEKINWLKENSKIYPRKELTIHYNKTFNDTLSYDGIVYYCKKYKIPALKLRYYNAIQEDWLKNNISKMSLDQLTIQFNKQFNTNKTKAALKAYCKYRNCYACKYTQEQHQWLQNNANDYTNKDLTTLFNKQFNTNRTQDAIRSYCHKHKLIKQRIYYSKDDFKLKSDWITAHSGTMPLRDLTAMFNKLFNTNYKSLKDFIYHNNIPRNKYVYTLLTKEEDNWIINTFNNQYTWDEFTELFNQHFNHNYTSKQIQVYVRKKLKLYTTKNERIQNYKEGYPIGSIVKADNGTTYIKLERTNKSTGGFRRPSWIPYKEYLYIQAYGPIKEDEFVISLDGSFNIDQLRVVTKSLYTIINTRGYANQGLLTEAMLEVLLTEKLIKEIKKEQ